MRDIRPQNGSPGSTNSAPGREPAPKGPDFLPAHRGWAGRRRRSPRPLALAALLATLLTTLLTLNPGGAHAEGSAGGSCNPEEFRPADPTLTQAQWVAPGRLRVRAGAGAGLQVVVRSRVNFGPLRYEWKAASLPLQGGQVRLIDVGVPAEAFLHPLATTYLADLLVRVETYDDAGRPRQEVALDPLYVAWPQGAGSAPVIWNGETMPPHGVLDPQLQQAASRVGPKARLGPPIAHLAGTRAKEEDTTGEDTPLEQQLPADPDDEEALS